MKYIPLVTTSEKFHAQLIQELSAHPDSLDRVEIKKRVVRLGKRRGRNLEELKL